MPLWCPTGCRPAGVLSEVVDKETGEMARTPLVLKMAKSFGLRCITIEALVRYRHDRAS
jgi:3,4-dihydroxy 2-butanone 4-phosphate synthase / GTP cyclohydrolase II